MSNILTIDVGTTSLRSILYGQNGNLLFQSQKKCRPLYCENNYVEQTPQTWEDALVESIQEIVEKASNLNLSIDALSLTSQRSSVIPVDRDGVPLYNAIMWQDKRSCDICNSYNEQLKFVYSKTGTKTSSVLSAPKMMWLKQNETEIYHKTYKLVGVHDFLIHLITNNFITDESLASRTQLFNIFDKKWDKELLDLFEIDKNKLCDVILPGSICGIVSKDFAKRVSLKHGIPVITAGGDQQCAALGLNIIEQGYVGANTGTGSYIIGCSDAPVLDDDMRLNCNISAIPGKWMVEASLLTSGIIYNWFNEVFYTEYQNSTSSAFEKMNQDAKDAPIGSNGLLLIPHFNGCTVPKINPSAKGLFWNLRVSNTRKDFARAILEGIAAEMADNLDIMSNLIEEIKTVSISGGLTKIDLFNQIQSDMYNKQVIKYTSCEATSLGAWISAAKTLGLYSSYEEAFNHSASSQNYTSYNPIPDNITKYEKIKAKKRKLFSVLNESGIYEIFDD